jgi:SAM-dependent MidA family methyltransferase
VSNDDKIYHTETHTAMQAFIKTVRQCLSKGQMIWLDYGYLAHEYYHENRNQGTLVTYLAHKVYYDLHAPLRNIGLQDISAHVDFSYLLDILEEDMQIDYFANQSHFLMDHGLLDWVAKTQSLQTLQNAQDLQHLQILLSEAEMGSLVKVVVASC